jgi:hypothetical protein
MIILSSPRSILRGQITKLSYEQRIANNTGRHGSNTEDEFKFWTSERASKQSIQRTAK